MHYLLWCQEQRCAVLSRRGQSLDQGQAEEDLLWKADLEAVEVEAETELVLPPPVVETAVHPDDGAEGLPVDPVADPAEAVALQRGRQDSRRQGQRGT